MTFIQFVQLDWSTWDRYVIQQDIAYIFLDVGANQNNLAKQIYQI